MITNGDIELVKMDKELLRPAEDYNLEDAYLKLIGIKRSNESDVVPLSEDKHDSRTESVKEEYTPPTSPMIFEEVYINKQVNLPVLNTFKQGLVASIIDLTNPQYMFTFNDIPKVHIKLKEGNYLNSMPDDFSPFGLRSKTPLILQRVDDFGNAIDDKVEKLENIAVKENKITNTIEDIAPATLTLSDVLTVSEVALVFGIPETTIKSALQNHRFNPHEHRKSGKVWLITKQGMQRIFKRGI